MAFIFWSIIAPGIALGLISGVVKIAQNTPAKRAKRIRAWRVSKGLDP